jgi:hypothetical protein
MLIHCRMGADRTGVASVLAAMAIGGQTYDQARSQLSIRYFHVDDDPDHIEGLLLSYEEHCKAKGVGTGGWSQFKAWALGAYWPGYYHVRITGPEKLAAAPGEHLRVELTIENLSGKTIPAGDDDKDFRTAVFSGSSEEDSPDREFGPRAPLPKQNVPPGASVKVSQTVEAPSAPGVYELHFDVVEENRTWFARQGSEVPACELTVRSP